MDMAARQHEQRTFFSTGRRQAEGVDAIDDLALHPALLAPYRDLTRLRYDFPLVLVDRGPGAGMVRSLTSVIDEVITEVAPRGIDGERQRKLALHLERAVREQLSRGEGGRLSAILKVVATRIAPPGETSVDLVLRQLADKLQLDGLVVDCDRSMPARVLEHVWQAAQKNKGKAFRAKLERLIVKLSDILRAAYLHSADGQKPDALRAALGGNHRDSFDFAVMSKLVVRNLRQDELPASRRGRIEAALVVLKTQPFYPDPRLANRSDAPTTFDFRFDNCAGAANAYRERLPKLAAVVKALAVAELESDGAYDEAEHDAFFEHFGEASLSADDIALFPDYFVAIPADKADAPENAGLLEILSAGLPVKILTEATDLLEEAAVGTGHFAFGVRSMRLANTATALGGVFVVQTVSSNLYALRQRLAKAFEHRGAGLFSVYAGAGAVGDLPPYLTAAAAMESRAFPAFTYDPYAGDNQAARFSLEDNPQPEADWPVAPFEYVDETLQRVTEETPFTVADFLLCDRRYADHFARVPRDRWNGAMIPADEWLARDPKESSDAVPYVLAVDDRSVLQRVIVDARLMQTVARTRTFWHRLQEQGGINNSHADILLSRERAKWEQAREKEIKALEALAATAAAPAAAGATSAEAAGVAAPAATPSAVAPPAAPERNPDESWIETARCPSCNECQIINDKMFLYNDNKQAYIGDLKAGTYRQMVEAAESCQVSIIHPGKPWNPGEPGLDELIARAEVFK